MITLKQLEDRFLPVFRKMAAEIYAEFPRVHTNVWSYPVGALTDYQGHGLGVECSIPINPADLAEQVQMQNVALMINLKHLSSKPEIDSVMVSWGSGQVEEKLIPEAGEIDEKKLLGIEKDLPKLYQVLNSGKARKTGNRMSSSSRLVGKVALITGGTSGIGEATARLFAREGALVAFTGRRAEKGKLVAAEIEASGGQALYIPADHTRAEDCRQVVKTVIERFGRLDILFNNAGVVLHGNAEQTSETDWQLTLDLNVTAVWRMSRLAIPQMRQQGGGVIVNNASDWGVVGAAEALAYCMSKGAVIQMTKAMALDHARENIRVNAVCPGDTFVERWVENGYFKGSGAVEREQALQESGEALPIGRVAAAEEIAKAVLFLASDDSSFITGSILVVDGGNTAR